MNQTILGFEVVVIIENQNNHTLIPKRSPATKPLLATVLLMMGLIEAKRLSLSTSTWQIRLYVIARNKNNDLGP